MTQEKWNMVAYVIIIAALIGGYLIIKSAMEEQEAVLKNDPYWKMIDQ